MKFDQDHAETGSNTTSPDVTSAAVAEGLPMDATRGGLACPRHVPAEPYAANH